MHDLVSVIVPVYNVEDYLDRCVQSIIHQTYNNLEIILVDDGSTDSGPDILDRLKSSDVRIKVFRQENGGLSAARNTGIENATGDYYLFVDSDDYINPKMVEILYDNLISNEADISVCDLHWVFEGEEIEEYLSNDISVYEGKGVLRKLIRDDLISVVAWNKLYKAYIFDDIRYPVGCLHEDEYVIHKILAKCKRSVYTKAKLYYYMKRAGSISNNISTKNVMDVQVAFCERLIWAVNYGDKKFSDWCFDLMLNEGNFVLRTFDSDDYVAFLKEIKLRVKETLDKVRFKRALTWRKVIVGYIWLKNPMASSKIRRLLHC